MITGDHPLTALHIARELGIAESDESRALVGHELSDMSPTDLQPVADDLSVYARVAPNDKLHIVQALQNNDEVVAMTGDGVNDAPALKQAEVGIAVSGATDAARSAADLVLTAPGLGVIIRAVEEARRIFGRMNAYAIYRITETIRIMIFMVLTMIIYDFYPITAVMIILLALLNDLPIMAIAKDNTWLDPRPVRWDMKRVLTAASVLGGIGVLETFLLLILAESWLGLSQPMLQTVLFLKLVVAGHLTLLVARTRGPFWKPPYPAGVLLTAILATQTVGVLIAGLGVFMTPIPWSYIAVIWGYCLVWLFIEDFAKRLVYAHLETTGPRLLRFLHIARLPLSGHWQHRGSRR
jgi:H+-transporting ATPase